MIFLKAELSNNTVRCSTGLCGSVPALSNKLLVRGFSIFQHVLNAETPVDNAENKPSRGYQASEQSVRSNFLRQRLSDARPKLFRIRVLQGESF